MKNDLTNSSSGQFIASLILLSQKHAALNCPFARRYVTNKTS